ncbi:13804_t:CDS:2 [Acaulospora colombiana]|uniref:13804_t:CDS:1 n=1 Tax=Acaulospora colombiana TaxID=27376 RepID=A0ACA9K461_9GLOM|nr:13804_t:CDS:2 [Acaulospora colombiana]
MTKTRSNSKDFTISNGSAIFNARVTRSAARSRGEKLVELSREGVEVVQKEDENNDGEEESEVEEEGEEEATREKDLEKDVEEIRFVIDNDDLSDTASEDSLSD